MGEGTGAGKVGHAPRQSDAPSVFSVLSQSSAHLVHLYQSFQKHTSTLMFLKEMPLDFSP